MSITLTSRSGQLYVAVVGDRTAVLPHLHRIIGHFDTALTDGDTAANTADR